MGILRTWGPFVFAAMCVAAIIVIIDLNLFRPMAIALAQAVPLLVAICAAYIGIETWKSVRPKSRPRWQFKLRTLFIVVTLASISLGLWRNDLLGTLAWAIINLSLLAFGIGAVLLAAWTSRAQPKA